MDWQKNNEIAEKYGMKRSLIDYILPVLIVIVACYVLALVFTLIFSGDDSFIRGFVNNVGKVAGAGVALSLLAFMPRTIRARKESSAHNLDVEVLYNKSDLKSKLSNIDKIVLIGSLITILTSLLLIPLYHAAQ